jgi:hypothetical protein
MTTEFPKSEATSERVIPTFNSLIRINDLSGTSDDVIKEHPVKNTNAAILVKCFIQFS